MDVEANFPPYLAVYRINSHPCLFLRVGLRGPSKNYYCVSCFVILLRSHFAIFVLIFEFQMTEKDFWTKYFRAEYLHSTRNAVAAAAEAADDEELAMFLKDDDILAREARRKVIIYFTFVHFNDVETLILHF